MDRDAVCCDSWDYKESDTIEATWQQQQQHCTGQQLGLVSYSSGKRTNKVEK